MTAPGRAPKLTVVTSYPVLPPQGGGQQRIHGLYGEVAALGVEVDIVALVGEDEPARVTRIAPGLRQLTVPKSSAHQRAEIQLAAEAGLPVTDIAMAAYHKLTPELRQTIVASAAEASLVVASHPFGAPAILDAGLDLPLVYEAHNVELDLKAQMLDGRHPAALDIVRACEQRACDEAEAVVVCAAADGERLGACFGVGSAKVIEVPNGSDHRALPFTGPGDRERARRSVGLEDPTVLFIGSWHEPNLEAGRAVLAAAAELPEVHVLLLGSAGPALVDEHVPANVDITGPVDRGFLQDALALASIAVNPMRSGSGTNLKMLDYALSGVSMVSSRFGARGLGFIPGEHYVLCEPGLLHETLREVLDEDPAATERRVELAYDRVVSVFDWSLIAGRWLGGPLMQKLLSTP